MRYLDESTGDIIDVQMADDIDHIYAGKVTRPTGQTFRFYLEMFPSYSHPSARFTQGSKQMTFTKAKYQRRLNQIISAVQGGFRAI